MAQKPTLRADVYSRALRASQNVMRAELWVGARCTPAHINPALYSRFRSCFRARSARKSVVHCARPVHTRAPVPRALPLKLARTFRARAGCCSPVDGFAPAPRTRSLLPALPSLSAPFSLPPTTHTLLGRGLVWFILPICKESKQAHCAWTLISRAVCSSAPLSGAASFLRTCRLG
jgi:hypothetical protein